MNDTSKSSGQQWLDSQQAMWNAFVPGMPTATTGTRPGATPLEEQFNELRDTWQASVVRWTDFAKEASNGEMPSADKLREMFAPAAWAQAHRPGRRGCGSC